MSTDWRKKEIAHWPQCVPPFGGRTIPEGGKGSGRFSCPPTVSTTSTDSMNERSLSFLRWGARRQRSVGNRAQTREKRLTSDIAGGESERAGGGPCSSGGIAEFCKGRQRWWSSP